MQQIFQYISSSLANVISDPSIGPTEDKDGKEGGGEGEGGEEKEQESKQPSETHGSKATFSSFLFGHS